MRLCERTGGDVTEGAEARRLGEARDGVAWKEWGPYLSERQWGTVREDYSDNGDAWSYFSHDQARSRAYKWGEDGIAGICDDHQRLCLAFAVWNGVDPILKERMFGLTNAEGNHGEDVKEYYFYLDATPTSSYLKYRYRYPLDEYPYADLLRTNAGRGRLDLEYELLDTGNLRRRPVRRRRRRVRQGRTGRHPRPRHPVESRARAGGGAPAPDAVVPQHLVDGRTEGRPRRRRRSASSRSAIRSSASSSCAAKAIRNCCSPRTRRTPNACGARPTPPRSSRTRSTASSSTARPTPSTPTRPAPRPPPTTSSASLPEAPRRSGCGCAAPGAKAVEAESGRTRCSPIGSPRPTSSTPRSRRPPRPPIRCR